jgi:hypothetical protein
VRWHVRRTGFKKMMQAQPLPLIWLRFRHGAARLHNALSSPSSEIRFHAGYGGRGPLSQYQAKSKACDSYELQAFNFVYETSKHQTGKEPEKQKK